MHATAHSQSGRFSAVLSLPLSDHNPRAAKVSLSQNPKADNTGSCLKETYNQFSPQYSSFLPCNKRLMKFDQHIYKWGPLHLSFSQVLDLLCVFFLLHIIAKKYSQILKLTCSKFCLLIFQLQTGGQCLLAKIVTLDFLLLISNFPPIK